MFPQKKVVTFFSNISVWEYNDYDYDRSSHPKAVLNKEELLYLQKLRDCMRKGEYIVDNLHLEPSPLPSRKIYFENFLSAWKKRERKAYDVQILNDVEMSAI